MSQKGIREVAELEKSSSGCSNFLHLFDEQWFIYNALSGRRFLSSHGGVNDAGELANTKQSLHEEPAEAAEAAVVTIEKAAFPSAHQLIRTPSLPPTGVGCEGKIGQEGKAVPRNYYLSGRKLRYSYSSLDAPQQSISSSSKSTGGPRPPKTESPHRRCANPHLVMCWEASYRKAFQNKKCRSLGDLETMELQGFKDLGFVFDDKEGLSSSLVRVIPALGERKEEEGEVGVRRLYLPEAWFTQRSAPPMVLRHVGFRSGDEMKEQLLFWARAVACNVRRKC